MYRNWRESKREEEQLKGKQALRLEAPRPQTTRPQVWPRKQEMPQQQVVTGPTPIKGVERTNVVMIQS